MGFLFHSCIPRLTRRTEVRANLVVLESRRLVAGRRDPDATRNGALRVYVVTAEGRRKAGVSDARSRPSTV